MTMDIRKKLSFIRLIPFDTSTEQGRSKERYRRIAFTATANAGAKAITIVTSLITVPLTLNYLGAERYGLWMTVSSVIAMMGFADFGIGNGLMNAIAEAYGKEDKIALKRHIANAFVILGIIAVLILLSFSVIYQFIDWGSFFNVKSLEAIQEAGPALSVFIVCFAIGMPAGVVQRVQMGLQEGFVSSIWQAGGSLLGLLLTLLVILLQGGLPWLILALGGAPVLVLILNGLFFFVFQRRDLLPTLSLISVGGMKRILQGGLLFFVLQLGVTVAYASDNLIIAKILGLDYVAQYSVVSKMFEGVLMVIGLAVTPLWPAYGEAKARGDLHWIKKTLVKSMLVTLIVVSIFALFLVFSYEPLLRLWVGTKYTFPFALVAWYAVWMVLKGLGTTYAMFLNGTNVIKPQLIITSIFVIISIPAKICLASYFGLNGILVALILSYSITVGIPYFMLSRKLLQN